MIVRTAPMDEILVPSVEQDRVDTVVNLGLVKFLSRQFVFYSDKDYTI